MVGNSNLIIFNAKLTSKTKKWNLYWRFCEKRSLVLHWLPWMQSRCRRRCQRTSHINFSLTFHITGLRTLQPSASMDSSAFGFLKISFICEVTHREEKRLSWIIIKPRWITLLWNEQAFIIFEEQQALSLKKRKNLLFIEKSFSEEFSLERTNKINLYR